MGILMITKWYLLFIIAAIVSPLDEAKGNGLEAATARAAAGPTDTAGVTTKPGHIAGPPAVTQGRPAAAAAALPEIGTNTVTNGAGTLDRPNTIPVLNEEMIKFQPLHEIVSGLFIAHNGSSDDYDDSFCAFVSTNDSQKQFQKFCKDTLKGLLERYQNVFRAVGVKNRELKQIFSQINDATKTAGQVQALSAQRSLQSNAGAKLEEIDGFLVQGLANARKFETERIDLARKMVQSNVIDRNDPKIFPKFTKLLARVQPPQITVPSYFEEAEIKLQAQRKEIADSKAIITQAIAATDERIALLNSPPGKPAIALADAERDSSGAATDADSKRIEAERRATAAAAAETENDPTRVADAQAAEERRRAAEAARRLAAANGETPTPDQVADSDRRDGETPGGDTVEATETWQKLLVGGTALVGAGLVAKSVLDKKKTKTEVAGSAGEALTPESAARAQELQTSINEGINQTETEYVDAQLASVDAATSEIQGDVDALTALRAEYIAAFEAAIADAEAAGDSERLAKLQAAFSRVNLRLTQYISEAELGIEDTIPAVTAES